MVKELDHLLYHLVRENPRKFERERSVDPRDELLIHRLEQALDEGRITDHQFRSNLKLLFLTGHENTQQLLHASFLKLGTDQVRRQLHEALQPSSP